MKKTGKRVVLKLGSNILVDKQKQINQKVIAETCRQIAALIRDGHHVVVVSSGAVASDSNAHRSKNLRSAVGQGRIFNAYARCMEDQGLEAAQLLLTDAQLLDGQNEVTLSVIEEAFRENVICIINANDVIDNEEIKALEICADNDRLAGLVCQLIKADVAIIAFGEQGLKAADGTIVRQVRPSDIETALSCAQGGSALGHGDEGMKTKILTLSTLAQAGLTALLVPGREEGFLLRAMAEEPDFGTRFLDE